MADIELLALRDKNFYKTAERVIFRDYKCNCTKGWKDVDRFLVYRADESGVIEIINDEVSDHNLDILIGLTRSNLREGANKRGNSSRLTQSFHFFMFEPIFSPVNALNQPI